MIDGSEWGDSASMAPLACVEKESCEEFATCYILGGEAGFSCNGQEVEIEDDTVYPENCRGICQRSAKCGFGENGYSEYCVEDCEQGVREGWQSSGMFACTNAVSCQRFSLCVNYMMYPDEGWGGDGGVMPADDAAMEMPDVAVEAPPPDGEPGMPEPVDDDEDDNE